MTENSWSSSDLSLNQYTIQGIVDTFRRSSRAAVGIHSTGYQWHKIVGSLPVSGVRANWVATGSPRRRMPRPIAGSGFPGHPSGSSSTFRSVSTLTTSANCFQLRSTKRANPMAYPQGLEPQP